MRKRLFAAAFALLAAFGAQAQKLYVGANWHPHDLSEAEIDRDLRLMRQAGLNVVRLGHLAWDSYEPAEGQYRFEWFDRVMDKCRDNGLGVVLDIPTRPAPMWLHKKYPGANIVGTDGATIYANTRYFEDVGDPDFQRLALALTDTMTRRYASHPALIGFGLDNEPGSGHISYSENVRRRFAAWLERKYKTVSALNTAWAGQRWSRRLSQWDEVVLPTGLGKRDGQPEKRLDFRRFVSDEINGFYFRMLGIIERNAPKAETYTNAWYYSTDKHYDYAPMAYSGRMTREGGGFYPGESLRKDGGLKRALFGIARSQYETPNPYWCNEFTTINATPGAVRKYAYMTLMYGNGMVCGWTWQTMHGGEEQYLLGMIDWDGTPNDKYYEYKQLAGEFRKLAPWFPYNPEADVAVALSFPSQMSTGMLGGGHDNKVEGVFNVAYERNMNLRVVDLTRSSLDYKLLFVPDVSVMDSVSASAIRRFVERGGTVVMTGNSACLDSTGQVFRTTMPGRLADVFGIRVARFEKTSNLNEHTGRGKGSRLTVDYKGRTMEMEAPRFDEIELRGAKATGVITSLDREYPLFTENRYGKGRAIFVGVNSDEKITAMLLDELTAGLGLRRGPEVPAGVRARQTDKSHILYFNATDKPQTISIGGRARSILKDKDYSGTFVIAPQDADFIEIRQ